MFALSVAEVISSEEPERYQEALRSVNWDKWKEAFESEMDSLMKNRTWNLVKRPEKQKVIGCRWILTRKPGIPGVEKPRFKSRLLAKGYSQKEGVDFGEIFSPVVKYVSIRVLLSMTVNYDLELEQLDVKTAFLHRRRYLYGAARRVCS